MFSIMISQTLVKYGLEYLLKECTRSVHQQYPTLPDPVTTIPCSIAKHST